jgi:transmembrane sensor
MNAQTPQPPPDDTIAEAASLWFARRRLQSPGEFDETAFRAWLAADARHASAYAAMAETAGAISVLPELRARKPKRAIWAAPLVGLAAAAAALLFVMGPLGQPSERHATSVGQIETLTLPDGTIVTLGAASDLSVSFSEHERRVRLSSGEAYFEVAHDAARPFYVETGDAQIRVVGTKFNVNHGGEAVRVAVSEGVVQVRPTPYFTIGTVQPVVLHAGEGVTVGDLAPVVIAQDMALIPTSAIIAPDSWRQGRLAYAEATLSDIVADINRYYAPGVHLEDPSLGAFRLTASFRVDELDTFLAALPDAAPIIVSRSADGGVTIAPTEAR